jgi:polyisoprenoid-binding protein YceI
MARYLVVGDQTLGSHAVLDELVERQAREACRFHIVVPASHPARGWTWNEGTDHAAAEHHLKRVLTGLQAVGLEATGEVGDPSPVQAVGDVLRRQPGDFDSIILATLPPGLSRRVGQDISQRVERNFSLPVHHLVVPLTRPYGDQEIPAVGTYRLDPHHSSVEFVVRFLMISRVRGRFTQFSGTMDVADRPEDSSVEILIDAASIDTGHDERDSHLRSADFLDVEHHPVIRFTSTAVELSAGESWRVRGDLDLRGVRRPVELDTEFHGVAGVEWGAPRAGFSASGEFDREEWGLTWNQPLDTGGVLIGKTVHIELNVQVVRSE